MSKRLIPQIYGYAVCLTAVITVVVTIHSFTDDVFSYAKPSSSYDCQYYTQPMDPTLKQDPTDLATSKQLCLDNVKDRGLRGMVNDGVVAVLALGLFLIHWRWVTKLPEDKA